MKTTQRDIRNHYGKDITNYSTEQCCELQRNHYLREVAYSMGIYGCNGKVFVDENGDFYKITSRTTALFAIG